MLSDQLLDGLKHFFKEEKLSDRILQIVEIDEAVNCGIKRSLPEESTPINMSGSLRSIKRPRLSIDSGIVDYGESMITTTEGVHDEETVSNVVSGTSVVSPKIDNDDDDDLPSSDDHTAIDGISENDSLQQQQRSNSTNSSCYAVFPVHSIVLSLSSEYFNKLLIESGMKEASMKTVTVKVDVGEGYYLEKLIEAFYDQDILEDTSLTELLKVLDIASRFSCVNFVKHGINVLIEKPVNSIQECDTILQYMSRIFQVNHTEKKYEEIKQKCLKYLSQSFYPLELKPEKQDVFKELAYTTVLYMLQSDFAFTTQENNTFLLIYMWLENNINSTNTMSAQIIESFFQHIQYESLSVNILTDQLHPNDKTLSFWPGYSTWFITALKYHSLTKIQRDTRGVASVTVPMRCIPNTGCYVTKHFVFDQQNKVLCDRAKNNLIWDGLQFTPILSLRQIEGESILKLKILAMSPFSPSPDFSSFYSKFDVYICILPGNMAVKQSMLYNKQFVFRYIRKSVFEFKKKSTCNIHTVAKIDQQFLPSLQKYGLNLVLFFRKNAGSWQKFETWNVKSVKKLIKLKEGNDLLNFA